MISSDPPWKDGNARFTMVPWKALSDEVWINVHDFAKGDLPGNILKLLELNTLELDNFNPIHPGQFHPPPTSIFCENSKSIWARKLKFSD